MRFFNPQSFSITHNKVRTNEKNCVVALGNLCSTLTWRLSSGGYREQHTVKGNLGRKQLNINCFLTVWLWPSQHLSSLVSLETILHSDIEGISDCHFLSDKPTASEKFPVIEERAVIANIFYTQFNHLAILSFSWVSKTLSVFSKMWTSDERGENRDENNLTSHQLETLRICFPFIPLLWWKTSWKWSCSISLHIT